MFKIFFGLDAEIFKIPFHGWKNYLFVLYLQLQMQLLYIQKFSITIIQVQVTVIQLQLQWKDSENVATNLLTFEASSFAYVNTSAVARAKDVSGH